MPMTERAEVRRNIILEQWMYVVIASLITIAPSSVVVCIPGTFIWVQKYGFSDLRGSPLLLISHHSRSGCPEFIEGENGHSKLTMLEHLDGPALHISSGVLPKT